MKPNNLLIILTFLTAMLPWSAKAQSNVSTWDGSAAIWTQGSGTQSDPYLIETAQNLAWISEMVNNGVTTYSGVYFKLTSDLDMNNIAWIPIGDGTNNFCGQFDGNNHFIDNIKISGDYTYGGLFGYITCGSNHGVKNLGVNINITGTCQYAGGIVAYFNCSNGVLRNCHSDGTIKATVCAGGIVGFCFATNISQCYNTGLITVSNSYAGGIVGSYKNGNNNYGYQRHITDCYNTGNVNGLSSSCTGGIFGFLSYGHTNSTTNIYNCVNNGRIFSYSNRASGIGGYCDNSYASSDTTFIQHCYNLGTDTTYSGAVAGIVVNSDIRSIVTNCYNRGKNVKKNASGSLYGIAGSGTVKNCYNTGMLSGGGSRYGIGNGSITNSYYLETCGSNQTTSGTSKTEATMKSPSFPVLLNSDSTAFVMDGTPNTNDGYPVFGSVSSKAATQVTFTKALLHGTYDINADVVGYQYKKSTASNYTTVYANVGTPSSYQLTGLQSGTQYTFRFFAEMGGATYYGQPLTFTTQSCDLQASVSKSVTEMCDGESATFTAAASSNLSNLFTYEWNNGGTDTAIHVSNGETYTVTVHDTNGCVATASASVVVHPLPQGVISGSTSLCTGESTTLTASGANSYHWSTGATTPVITVNNSGTYTCTFTNSYGCTATQSVTVSVFATPVITGNTAICDGSSTTLTATGGNSFVWSNGATTSSITVNAAGTYTVTATQGNCSASSNVTTTVVGSPTPTITGNTTVCQGESATLVANGGYSYLWSTGSTTATITVDESGTYTVTATNAGGCTGTANFALTVKPRPVVTISGETSFCQGSTTLLTASGASSYEWSDGSNTASIYAGNAGQYSVVGTASNGCSQEASVNVSMNIAYQQFCSHTICQGESYNFYGQILTSTGSYTQTLTASNGCDSVIVLSLEVNPAPSVYITGNTSLCVGESTTLVANGGNTYQWSNGESGASITVSQSGNYSVLATNAAGCTSQTSVAVVVNPLPNITISGSQTLCAGTSTTLTASGANSYVWGNGSNTASISVTSAGDYSVTGTNSHGCSNTATLSVVVNPVPQGVISGNTNLCLGESTTLTASGANSYAWSNGSTQSAITVNTGGTYSCVFTNGYGCSSTESVTVTAQTQPTISGATVLCQGNSTTLSATGGNSYQWSNGETGSSIIVQNSGQYTVTAYMGNCSATASVNVAVYPLPSAIILGNTSLCQGQSTTLTANGGGSYLWDNGSTQSTIMVNTGGTYFVTVSNSAGCSSTTNVTVTINPLPNVIITGNNAICQNSTTTLTATGASTYSWSNNQSGNTVTVNNAGTYTVTGTDANGCANTATKTVSISPTYNIPLAHSMCQGDSYNFYGQNITTAGTYTHTLQTVNGCDSVLTLVVTLEALPTTAITGTTTLCEGETTTLTANGGVSYVWSNGSTTNSINVAQSGVYTVTATNAEGCSASTNVTVTVNPLPNVNITGNSSFCQGDNTTLTATGASTYAWSNSQTSNTITVSNAGTYTVTGTDANGCANTDTKTISVNPTYNIPLTHSICQGESYNFHGQNLTTSGTYTHILQTVNGCDSVLTLTLTVIPQPNLTITGNTSLCEGQSTVLTVNGGVSYAWSNASTNNSINVAQSGVYTVTATNVQGCTATATATVTVNPLPIVVIGGNTSICEGGSTTLTASGADTYSWSTGDNTASTSISAFGIYYVTGTSAAGCSSVASVTVLVSQAPQITITGETDICAGESTTLTATGGTSYIWSNGTTDATLTVSTPGTWQVIGYNEAGCNAMASATVNVWQPATSEFSISCPDSCYIWNDQSYCASGDYTQTLQTVHGCDSVVTMHLTITVGLDDHDGFDFKVYPNPTSNIVNVECIMKNEEWGNVELYLCDAYGRLLDVVRANNDSPLQTAQIDLSRYANGIYFVKAVAEGKVVVVRKVVKE